MLVRVDNSSYRWVERSPHPFVHKRERIFRLAPSGLLTLMAAFKFLGIHRPLISALSPSRIAQTCNLMSLGAVVADVSPFTACLSVASIEEQDLDSFDTVVVSCTSSLIPDLHELQDFCNLRGKKLIVDASEAFGAEQVHLYGDLTVYCFGDDTVYDGFGMGLTYMDESLVDRYDFETSALFGSRILEGQPLENLFLDGLTGVEQSVECRKINANLYRDFAPSVVPELSFFEPAPTVMPLITSSKYFRQQLSFLLEQDMVPFGSFPSLLKLAPIATDLYRRTVTVPVHEGMNEESIRSVCNYISKI